MSEIGKFLRYKSFDISLFLVFLLLLLSSGLFGIDRNYIFYLMLCSSLLFLIHIYISYKRYKKILEELSQWTKEPTSPVPTPFENTDFAKVMTANYHRRREELASYEEKFQSFKDYITLWSHQIKTPLFALNLLLQDDSIDEIEAQGEIFKVEEYIETLLSYIRLESDTTDYLFEKRELDALIIASLRKYSKVILKRKNQIYFTETERIITTDEKWFSFILEQILSNANKYTKNGKISIYLKGNSLVVEDTGIGIRPEDIPRIFEKSYTGFNGRLYRKSSGLGLALVRQVSDNLNIPISLTSEIDQGTKVYFDLSKMSN